MDWSTFFAHDNDLDVVFEFFSFAHYLFMSIAIIATILTLRYAKKIKISKHEKTIKYVIMSMLIILESGYHIHNLVNGKFSVPLHVCSAAVILAIILLATNNYKVFEATFLLGILGGYAALFIPDLAHYTYVNMRFYHFLIVHMLIIVVPLYYYKAYNYRITMTSIKRSFILLFAMSPFALVINYTMDRNYMFIGEKPEVIAQYLPPWPSYVLIFAGIIFLVFYALLKISNYDYSKLSKNKKRN